MSNVDITVEVCGMSGDGTIAAGGLLNEAMSKAGYSIIAFDSYPAEIRGFGRCVTYSRIGDRAMSALSDETHVLISLDDEQSLSRIPFLADDGVVFFDNNPPSYISEDRSIAAHLEPNITLFGVPFADLAASAGGTTRGKNLTALGSFVGIYGISPQPFEEVVKKKFGPKGEKVVEANLKSFEAGYRYALETYKDRIKDTFSHRGAQDVEEKVLISGNVAIAKGAMDAGLKLYFGYPITPATPIMEYLAKALPERGGKVVQMEDEISSIGAVLGAFFAGSRAMTATSGPGFALMTELITHGIMAEIPAVIIDAQRAGPSTGLPTKTEQSDLHAAVFGGPGDSPRIVIAPTNVSECYEYTLKSFQIAERYQTPVVVLTDFFLNNRVENIPPPEASEAERADGNVYPDPNAKFKYRRYEMTESGISPRALPGMEGFVFSATGLEHVEKGTPNYSPENHTKMTEKRYRKIKTALNDLYPPQEYSSGGTLDLGIIGWGSTFGSVLEAVQKLLKKGLNVGGLKITSIYPFHGQVIREFMGRCEDILIPELNYEGQLANLIDYLFQKDVVRLTLNTGLPFPVSRILEKSEEILGGKG